MEMYREKQYLSLNPCFSLQFIVGCEQKNQFCHLNYLLIYFYLFKISYFILY